MNYKRLTKLGLGVLLSSMPLLAAVDANMGADVINSKCTACHTGNLKDGLSRISDQRKTPEGWYMTVMRMQRLHGLSITAEEQANVIKYLGDHQGLTQDEIKPYAYILDKTPNAREEGKDELLTEMCVRCHSEARIGLQRRTADEWTRLVHFHVGQFASFEVQAKARDKDWFGVALNEIVPYLATNFGKTPQVWSDYQTSLNDFKLPTEWSVYGHTPGKGDFSAEYALKKNKDETYSVTMTSRYVDGDVMQAKGIAILYGKTELRASLEQDGIRFKQIVHINAKEKTFEGRMFETLHNENGSVLSATANSKKELAIAGVYPKSIKTGQTAIMTIIGSNLSKEIKFSSSVKVLKTLYSDSNKVVLSVEASKNAKPSSITMTMGNKTLEQSLAVYSMVDSLKVTPEYAIARTGGEGDAKILKQYATFEAIGYINGADGKPDTEDDIELGVLPVTWNMDAYDETAVEDKDVLFAGSINRYTGKFTPSEDGLNPKRVYSTNNVGNLKIIATYVSEDNQVDAEAHLIATVPKFINPPIN